MKTTPWSEIKKEHGPGTAQTLSRHTQVLETLRSWLRESEEEVNLHASSPSYAVGHPLTPNQYQLLAMRTASSACFNDVTLRAADSAALDNAILGLADEVGEILGAMKKHRYHGKDFPAENLREELGDLMWYVAMTCTALGVPLERVMRENVAKLQIRYPAGFSVADSENRSYEKESVAFQQSPVETTTSPVEASLMRAAAQVAPVPSLLDLTWRQGQLVYLDVPLLAVINVNGQFRRSDLQARLRYVFTTVKGWTPGESSWENFVDETCGKLRSVGYQQIDE